ncbi:hypothetical protein TNCV_1442491 [Trichonephila clavipes]|uniref:Uncharacterized protein n=1 Tax=Trichonephila clavipes TaxID=2585209 RepID=A0A8X6RL80_TRICX|nr:hypothetical protein TNCV_1442491 [Trichonephila clavipes]
MLVMELKPHSLASGCESAQCSFDDGQWASAGIFFCVGVSVPKCFLMYPVRLLDFEWHRDKATTIKQSLKKPEPIAIGFPVDHRTLDTNLLRLDCNLFCMVKETKVLVLNQRCSFDEVKEKETISQELSDFMSPKKIVIL